MQYDLFKMYTLVKILMLPVGEYKYSTITYATFYFVDYGLLLAWPIPLSPLQHGNILFVESVRKKTSVCPCVKLEKYIRVDP